MEILYYSDTKTDLDAVVKFLKISSIKRLIKLILISEDCKLLEQLPTLAKHASLIAIRLRQINKQTLRVLELASCLASIYKFILVPIIGDIYFQPESYNYSNISNVIIDGLWQCCILSRMRLLAKHLCELLESKNSIEVKEGYKPEEGEVFKFNEVPLKNQNNNILICCYGINENDNLLRQITQKVILARQRPIIVYNKGQSQLNWLINCDLIRTKYIPKIELNVMAFCTIPTIKFNKIVSVQAVQSEKSLKQILGDLIGLKTSEVVRKV